MFCRSLAALAAASGYGGLLIPYTSGHQVQGWEPGGEMVSGIYGGTTIEFNAFIGRDRELRELRALAAGARALTLCGAGGIGKTRLALHLLAELAVGYPDGAWFVELADLRQPELVASRI